MYVSFYKLHDTKPKRRGPQLVRHGDALQNAITMA
jgi:hypothetical protein